MKNKLVKRILSAGLMAVMTLTLVVGCGGKGDSDKGGSAGGGGSSDDFAGKSADFTWWIGSGSNEYYEKFEDNSVAQFINQQYWDTEKGGIGTAENGRKLNLSFLVPIKGSEMDNFNTMIGTGEYPEIITLQYSGESAEAMHDNGILMDITEYVEKFMPNYVAYLDANPELKPLVQVADEEGNAHYYAIYPFVDGLEDPWGGTCYRRDWIVKYAEPTEYVWDWESDYVKENGHPAVTPLDKAIKEDNLEGWKENEVTSFHSEEGTDPKVDYTDNVIFPSGTQDPLTISDWEWMFKAFDKAIDERGWADDSGAYGFSIQYYGYSSLGEVTSSFGGGTGSYYVKDGTVTYDGTSENFKTYIECMQTWYQNGWLDPNFNTRAGDMFFMIDAAGVNQGKVGMWYGLVSSLGEAIRVSCQDPSDQEDAFVMGCALPINDMYGSEEQMYKEPDALYQDSRKGAPIGITYKAQDKDLETLFTYFDWTYTLEGAKVIRLGLNAEQQKSVDLNPDIFADYDFDTAYTETTDENGKTVVESTFSASDPIFDALLGQTLDTGLKLTSIGEYCTYDKGNPPIIQQSQTQWTKYLNIGNTKDYSALLNAEESEQYNKVSTLASDYQAQNVPNVIKGTMSWEDYVKGFDNIDTSGAVALLQKYVDLANTAKKK